MIDDNVLSAIRSVLASNSERRGTCCIVVFVDSQEMGIGFVSFLYSAVLAGIVT